MRIAEAEALVGIGRVQGARDVLSDWGPAPWGRTSGGIASDSCGGGLSRALSGRRGIDAGDRRHGTVVERLRNRAELAARLASQPPSPVPSVSPSLGADANPARR